LYGEAAGGSSGGVHIVAGRAENVVFVVSQNSPSARMHVITTPEKIIYP
jgi:hypothetical protein